MAYPMTSMEPVGEVDGHGHGHGHDDHEEEEDEGGEWMQLLKPSELRDVLELERARKEVERQIIHSNQAKLSGRSEAERRGKTPSSNRIAGAGVGGVRDVMSAMYSQDVEVEHLAKLLPRPGDGEKQKQLAWQKGMDSTNGFLAGPWFGVTTMMVTAASVALYLYETTLDYDDDETSGGGWTKTGHRYPDWFPAAEDALLAFFGAELGLRAILADHDRSFWLSTETVVDVLSLLPSVLFVAFDLRLWGFLRFLRLLRWADIMTLVERRRKRKPERDDEGVTTDEIAEGASKWKHESLLAALKLLAFVTRFVLVYAGGVLLLDRTEGGIEDISASDPGEALEFTSALYMAAMMLSTVGEGGYGPVPVSPYARVASAIAVLVFLPLAAIRVADVIKHSSTAKSAVRTVTLRPGVRERHVILCGSVNAGNLKARLQEIFHADHGQHNVRWVRVVVLSPEPPSARINALLARPRYRGRVTYIQGSPLDDDSLKKAGVDDAAAVMVLADKAARSSHAEDMNLSLQAISIMTHVELERRQGYGPRLLVELVDPNAALHLQAAGISQVVSSAQLKLSVLGQSCLCPGWSAVVANLLESRAAIPPQALQQGSWLAEYYVGAKKTFYSVEFSPAFEGVLFSDAVVHIFEHFELVLAAVEMKHRTNEYDVVVNPSDGYRICKGDRGFVLAESQADARVIWDYMAHFGKGGAVDEMGHLSERFSSPEEEEALAMETLGTAGVAAMGPQAFVDSMMFSRTLIHCQRKLPEGEAPDAELILEWARHFQESDGVSDEMVVRKILASAGLVPPRSVFLNSIPPPTRAEAAAAAAAAAVAVAEEEEEEEAEPIEDDTPTTRVTAAVAPAAVAVANRPESMPELFDLEAVPESPLLLESTPSSKGEGVSASKFRDSGSVGHGAQEEEGEEDAEGNKKDEVLISLDDEGEEGGDERPAQLPSTEGERTVEPSPMPRKVPRTTSTASSSAGGGGSGDFTGEEILSALRTMEVSSLNGEEACRRLLALRSAAKAAPSPSPATAGVATKTHTTATMTAHAFTSIAATNTPVITCVDKETSPPSIAGSTIEGARSAAIPPVGEDMDVNASIVSLRNSGSGAVTSGRRLASARHLVGHVIVLGFPARPSHLECFLRPLKGWTGGAGVGGGQEYGGGGVAVVLVAPKVDQLESAMAVVDRNGHVNTNEVYLMEGSPVSQSDLEKAGVSTAKVVVVMKDPRSRMAAEGILGDPLRDAEALVSFIKMEDGLLTPSQHVVVELESKSNVRFLHARTDGKTLRAIAGLGGAGAGGAADEAHYLWPKYAAGMTYNSSFVDSLFGQAFYRPSRIAFIERLLLLDRGENRGQSGMASTSAAQVQGLGSATASAMGGGGDDSSTSAGAPERECCLRQISVPPRFLGHSFGEMFQHLAAPPLRCVAFALLRARGTRNAPEPYVYTGPRADTVLHRGDKVFVLGKPPVL